MRGALLRVALIASFVVGLVALPPPAAAHVDVQFGSPTAQVEFGRSIVFEQPVSLARSAIRRVEFLIQFEGDLGPRVREVQAAGELASGTLRYTWDLVEDHVFPNTDVEWGFRITAEDGHTTSGPVTSFTYRDDRFEWQTVESSTPGGSAVRVHWYAGDEEFGRRALDIARQAIARSEERLGVTEHEPVDFFIYRDSEDFYGALNAAEQENVGGIAPSWIRTLFAKIDPSEVNASWVEEVIPHELSHLVFHTTVDNPYNHPPFWLDEGLAVYDSVGYGAEYRLQVDAALAQGVLIPLEGLRDRFPETNEQFTLAYGEAVSAVDFIVRTHGADALVRLVRSYREGISHDEAFEAALGMTLAEFDLAWQRDLGASPTAYGPQPAPPGPLPSGWSRTPVAAPAATQGPSAAPSTAPSPIPSAAASAAESQVAGQPTTATTATPAAASATAIAGGTAVPAPTRVDPGTVPTADGGNSGRDAGYLLGGLALILAVVGTVLLLNSRRASARR